MLAMAWEELVAFSVGAADGVDSWGVTRRAGRVGAATAWRAPPGGKREPAMDDLPDAGLPPGGIAGRASAPAATAASPGP